MKAISKKNPYPKYYQLRLILEDMIIRQELKEGARMPSEPELTKKYNLSLSCVRKCIYDMVNDSVLWRKHGVGTFVKNISKIKKKNIERHYKAIGLIIPNITGGFFPVLARGAEDAARERGYSLILCNSDNKELKEISYLKDLYKKKTSGIIIGTGLESYKDKYIEKIQDKIPIVVVDNTCLGGIEFDCVFTDDEQGAYNAVSYLIKLGHQRIAHIRGPVNSFTAREREKGYRKAMQAGGLIVDNNMIIPIGNNEKKNGEHIADYLLGLDKRPTAIFAYNDQVAAGVMQAVKRKHLSIPKDISLVGYGNVLGNHPDIILTTFDQPAYQMGRKAVELLLDKTAGIESVKKKRVVLRTKLIVRESCAPLGAAKPPRSPGRSAPAEPGHYACASQAAWQPKLNYGDRIPS